MIHVFDPLDARLYFDQMKAAGRVPENIKFDGVVFSRGGAVQIDGSAKFGFIGFDIKAQLVVKLLSDGKTLRARFVEVKVSGVGTRSLALKALQQFVEGLKVPGLYWRDDTTGGYVEYVNSFPWIILRDIQTNDNKLTLVQDFNAPLMLEIFSKGKENA